MGLPSQRRTKSSKKQRASHFALKKRGTTSCSNCKKVILPHIACPHCGEYKGRKVINVEKRKARRAIHTKPLS